MKYVYQLIAEGVTNCDWKDSVYSKTVFTNREEAEKRIEKFKALVSNPDRLGAIINPKITVVFLNSSCTKVDMNMLTGKDYPHLCKECQAAIDDAAMLFGEDGPDTDNPEAACDYVYDHRMFCGGGCCVNKGESSGLETETV